MARPLTYTTKRRLLMQAVMIAILGGTLGLAAWVRHARVGESGVPLKLSYDLPLVSGRLPGWEATEGIRTRPLPEIFVQAIEASDPAGKTLGRAISVTQEPALSGTNPRDHLAARYGVPSTANFQPIKFAGRKGLIVQAPKAMESTLYKGTVWHAYACIILTPGTAITVHLELPNAAPDSRDMALLRQVAQSIRLIDSREGRRLAL